MRIVLIFCLVVFAEYVYSENCTLSDNCSATTCTSDFHVVCEHPNPSAGIVAGEGLCTCAVTDISCNYRTDCQTDAMLNTLSCMSISRLHCYDNRCICSRF